MGLSSRTRRAQRRALIFGGYGYYDVKHTAVSHPGDLKHRGQPVHRRLIHNVVELLQRTGEPLL